MAARMLWMFFLPAACSLHVEVNSEKLVYQVGEKLNLNCSLVDCSEDPSVSWSILGDAPLGAESQRYISPTVTLLVISNVTLAHEARFLCKTSCGMQKRHKATSVKVYSFPDNPVVSGNDRLLPGVKNDLTCRVSDVYPAQGLRIEWIQGGGVLKTDDGEWSAKLQGVSSVYSLPPENNGENITCRATLNVTKDIHLMKETTVALTVLTPPRTVSTTVSPAVEVKGGSVSTSHVSDRGSDNSLELNSVREGLETRLQSSPPTSLTYKPPSVQPTDSGNQPGNQTASTQVRRLAPPRNVSITVSPAEEVKEGVSVSISCVSHGGVDGSLELRRVREGQETRLNRSLDIPTNLTYKLPSVQLTDSGLYQCVAANQAGNQTASAQVRVLAPPRDITVTSHPSWSVQEGQNVTISCSTMSFPKAITALKKLANGSELRSLDGTFHLIHLQLSDAGRYQVNVSNKLGFHTEEFELSVMGSSTSPSETLDLKKVIIPTVGTGTMLAAAAAIIRYLRKSKGADAYSLAMNALPAV